MSQLAAPFDHDAGVLAAFGLARGTFESWSDGPDDPPLSHPVDAMQLALMRWQRARFGDQLDERIALGVIEEMCEGFIADGPSQAEDALDALGDVCVYAAQLATANRLAIAPMLDLARVFTKRSGMRLICAPGVLAQVVLKRSQKIRGYDDDTTYKVRLVAAIAMCVAYAIDHVEIMHDVRVKAAEVFVVVGNEVLKRGDGHEAIPKPKPQEAPVLSLEERKQTAFDEMQRVLPNVEQIPEGAFDTSDAGASKIE